ncbi:uncharacterized protein EV154DRAFT_450112, partial [Mucor mucedo]|uniref:uncharacterized protein n=1 Tax=Mucor mucedo TaxID=29922 RepID=UPI00221F64F7
MLKQACKSFLSKKSFQQGEINTLCSRLGLLKFYTTTTKPHVSERDKDLNDVYKHLSPAELLRQEAQKVEVECFLRPRCLWLEEEDAKIIKMVNDLGKRWTFISKHFVDRPPSTLMNRYSLLTDGKGRGPWTDEEVKQLKALGNHRSPDEIDNWQEIQAKLPVYRPLFLIKQKYTYSLNPVIKFGHWSQEESDKLERLITKYGENEISMVAQLMGTRTKRQCLERWRWQMASVKKGRFSPEEDRKIIQAVQKYGENFAVVAKVIDSDRTARHISQHYRNILAPDIDRSPWTPEEQLRLYQVCLKNNKNMITTKKELGSRRAIRDLWNHFNAQKKYEEALPLTNTDHSERAQELQKEDEKIT